MDFSQPQTNGFFNKGRQGRFLGKYCRKKFSKDNLISWRHNKLFQVYDSYSLFADMGGLVGILLGISCLTVFDQAMELAAWAANKLDSHNQKL